MPEMQLHGKHTASSYRVVPCNTVQLNDDHIASGCRVLLCGTLIFKEKAKGS